MHAMKPQKWPWLYSIIINLVVAILYCITGYLGLFLATPPGYATPIWIPSGIALGAALVWGLRTVPGVFLGSLITNFFITTGIIASTAFISQPLAIGIVIASGATLQVIVGWWLIKRFLGLNNVLCYPNDILLFAFLAGPISCLINATWSDTALLFMGVLKPTNYFSNWTTWWIGDSIGVLVITPLFLILFGQPKKIWRDRILPVVVPLCLSFAGVIFVYFLFYSSEVRRIESSFSQVVSNDLVNLESKLANVDIHNVDAATIKNIIDSVFTADKNNFNTIKITNITNPKKIATIYHYDNHEIKTAALTKHVSTSNKLEIQNEQIAINTSASTNFIFSKFSWNLWSLLVSGLLFCVLMNICLFIVSGQRWLAQVETRKKNRALKNKEYLNLSILRSAGEGIYGLNTQGKLTFINPKGAKMLGYEENELIGKYVHDLIHHSHPDGSRYAPETCPIYGTFRYNQIQHISDEVFWKKDGSCFWVEYTTTPLKEGENISGAVVVFNDVSKRREMELELKRMAHFDILTGLPNRGSFFEHLALALTQAKETNQQVAVCFIDLDNFKQINDSLGHNIGDLTLKAAANILKSQLNNVDYFARLGGDEFAVIIENIHSIDNVNLTMEQIIRAVKQPIKISGAEINLSMSIGVALYPQAGTAPEEIIISADIAMYHAKDLGKGTYAFFNDEINKQVKRRHQIDMKMRHALGKEEFSLAYQYLVNSHTLQPIGIEALLRWHNADLGNIPPKEFIAIAETNGLIHAIGIWAMRQACADYKKIITLYDKSDLSLSFNVSVIQLENPVFIDILKSAITVNRIKPENIILEITETELMQNVEHMAKIMAEIKKIGVRLALDDFGVSYSSMQYLKNLPISLIKIDQIYTHDITKNASDAEIVNATIQLSHGMGIHTIAEGVETIEQLEALRKMGCEYVQGNYISEPASFEKVLEQNIFQQK